MVIWQISTDCCLGTFYIIGISGEDNSTCHCACVLYFCVILGVLHPLWQLLLLYFWKLFGQTLKKNVFLVEKLWLINDHVIFLCLFWNYLSVSKLNCLFLFLLILLIFSLYKWWCPNILSILFYFDCYQIIQFIYHNS